MIIVKVGGGAAINLEGVAQDISELEEEVVIVHGANALRDELAAKLDIPRETVTSASGYSSVLSDEQTIDLQMLAYAGLRNKRLVELLQQKGVNALGLSGLDGRLIQGARNKGIRVRDGEKVRIVRDFSGKPKQINIELLQYLLSAGYTPVLCVPILDENGFAINSENDDIVSLLHQSMGASRIVQLIEAPGFLDDPNKPESLVKEMSRRELEEREQQVKGRMKRKMLALKKLFSKEGACVYISDGRTEHPLKDALNGQGTRIE